MPSDPRRPDAPSSGLAKEIADFWDNHCECYSKDFNREGYLREIINNWLIAHDARVEARARLAEHQLLCVYCNQGAAGCDRGRELESAARESGGQT